MFDFNAVDPKTGKVILRRYKSSMVHLYFQFFIVFGMFFVYQDF